MNECRSLTGTNTASNQMLVNQSQDTKDDEVGGYDEVKQPWCQQDSDPRSYGQYRDELEVQCHWKNSFIVSSSAA